MDLRELKDSLGLNATVLALSLARMGDAIGNSILFIILPLYVAKIPEITFPYALPVLVGLLISSYGLAAAIFQPLTAALSDRFGHHKYFIQIGLAILGFATLGFSAANRYLDLLGLRILQGLGLALEIPPTMAIMTIVTRKETRGGGMGIYTTMRMGGLATGPLIGGYLHTRYGFETAFFTGAAILFASIPLVQIWVNPRRTSAEPKERARPGFFVPSLLFDPGILSAAFATFVMAAAFTLITTLENEYNRRLNINAFHFGLAFSSLMISRLVFQIPVGHLSDRLGRRPFVIGGLILLAPVTALLGIVANLFQFVLLRLIQGVAASAIIAPALALAGDLSKGGGESRQTSVVTMGFALGIAIGPLLAGFLSVWYFELPFIVIGVLSLLGAWVVNHYMPETLDQDRKEASESMEEGF
jgi:MFS family permease